MWSVIYKKDLEKVTQQYEILSENLERILLLETSDAYVVPRYLTNFYPSEYIQFYYGKNDRNFPKTKIKFVKTLKEKQVPIVESVIKKYQKQSYVNGIIKAQPGIGKTVMSIYLAAKLGFKTCIVIDSDVLLKQWIREIYKFSNLTENDIGIIKGNMMTVDRPICIAMVQTLVSKIKKNFSKIYKEIDAGDFGLVVYDEVHSTSASEKFSKSSILFRTKNILGLSATPFHNHIQEVVMKSVVGDIIYETKDYDSIPKYDLVYYHSNIPQKTLNGALYRIKDYIRLKSFYNSLLTTNEYLETIRILTDELLADGHIILIMVVTVKQVTMISEYLEKHGIPNRRYYGNEREELEYGVHKVIIGTRSFCGKGFDHDEFTSLILGSTLAGKKSLIQVVGRILRKSHNNPPVVKDLIDLSFPQLFMNEVKIKKSIISGEFNSEIREVYLK